jgi:hypothetical protein
MKNIAKRGMKLTQTMVIITVTTRTMITANKLIVKSLIVVLIMVIR